MSDEPWKSASLSSRIGALTLVRVVGGGASAMVYQSRSESGVQYAVKVIRAGRPDARRRKRVLKEILLHTLVSSHPNVVPLLDVLSNDSSSENDYWPRYTFLVLPYAVSGDLYTLILETKLFLNKPTLSRSVFLQILCAIQHCHSMGVFHRDIKSENILAFDNGRRVMLADFGLATTHTRSREWVVGTLSHMSPECMGGSYEPEMGYSPAANDIWSLGILLVNLLTGRNPWHKATLSDKSFVEYCRGPSEYLTRALPISSQAKLILRRVFVAEDHRPNVAAVIASVGATQEWYDADAVFEGCMARWRQPEDRVGHDGWVQCERTPHKRSETLHPRFSDESVYNVDHDLQGRASPVKSGFDLVRWRQSGFSSEHVTPFSQGVISRLSAVMLNGGGSGSEILNLLGGTKPSRPLPSYSINPAGTYGRHLNHSCRWTVVSARPTFRRLRTASREFSRSRSRS